MNLLVRDVKRALDEIKRLKGRVDSFSSGSTLIQSGNTVSGVLLSNADPTTLNDGDLPTPGVSLEGARADHGHGENVSGVVLSDLDPTTITSGDLPDPGVADEAARIDHLHGVDIEAGGQYQQFVYTNDNPFQFVTDGAGQPVFSLEDLV